MAYIGKEPADSFISFAKQDFSTSATTSYTLDNAVANENELALFINFVRQEPTTAYTASGTTLTLTSATTSSDDMYCVYLGQAKQTVNPPDGSVSAAKLASDSVTAAKLNDDIISGQTALASEPADTDEFLVSDAGTLKRIDYSLIKGGGITSASMFRLTTTFQNDATITSNIEEIDSDGYGGLGNAVTESSGVFTFPSTGIWLILAQASFQTESGQSDNFSKINIMVTTNNSSYDPAASGWQGGIDSTEYRGVTTHHILDVTDTSTHKVKFEIDVNNTQTYTLGNSTSTNTGFSFIRLGDT